MGLLDLLGSAAGGTGGQAGLLGHLTELVGGAQGSGLGSLVQDFQARGLGGLIGSWVSTGANLPIAPEQVTQVLGQERMARIAGAVGMDPNALAGQISTVLPGLIDRLTPHGQLPDGTPAEQIAAGAVPAS